MDQSVQEDFAYLESLDDGVIDVTSTDLENKTWIVVYLSDTKPVKYYLYNRDTRQARFLFTNRSDLAKCELAPMHPVLIKSRDGLDMVSYLTLPNDAVAHKSSTRPIKPLPLILNVHGGPTARDSWGLNAEHQWFSNRGYAVLSVNYRSSIGFGKEFINKGRGEWGGCMHDDLIDAVNWAVDNKIAARDKVAIYGGSYGGYAALVGLTFTPDVFACAVDIVGPSNLITLLKSIPPYWQPYYVELIRRTGGDPDTEEGRKFLESRSPLTFADRIKKPLLIAQGANDPRVKQAEADQIVAAMEANGIPFTYALYPDEGHGFARPENRISFYAVVEEFLQKHLGGKAEPIGNAFEGASVQIKEN
jgi:dipeptidyl aminopeptidase/acylaminoacyl peptidase